MVCVSVWGVCMAIAIAVDLCMVVVWWMMDLLDMGWDSVHDTPCIAHRSQVEVGRCRGEIERLQG